MCVFGIAKAPHNFFHAYFRCCCSESWVFIFKLSHESTIKRWARFVRENTVLWECVPNTDGKCLEQYPKAENVLLLQLCVVRLLFGFKANLRTTGRYVVCISYSYRQLESSIAQFNYTHIYIRNRTKPIKIIRTIVAATRCRWRYIHIYTYTSVLSVCLCAHAFLCICVFCWE